MHRKRWSKMKDTTKLSSRSFITTILIVVLLLVSLSTATYAWFSANNVVGISELDFAASTNTATPDLYFSWHKIDDPRAVFAEKQHVNNGNFELFTWDAHLRVVPTNGDDDLAPMMPAVAPYKGQTIQEFSDIFFTASTTKGYDEVNQRFVDIYREDGRVKYPRRLGHDPYYYDVEYTQNAQVDSTASIFVNNINPELPLRMRIKYKVKGNNTNDIQDKLHIAVFVDGLLIGIIGRYPWIKYGPIVKDADVDVISGIVNEKLEPVELGTEEPTLEEFKDGLYEKVSSFSFILPANGSRKVTMYAWYDGLLMENDNASTFGGLTRKTQASFELIGSYAEPGITE